MLRLTAAVLLFWLCQTAGSDGVFSISLDRYDNPNSALNSVPQEPCDVIGGLTPCDMRFIVHYKFASEPAYSHDTGEHSDVTWVADIYKKLNVAFTGAFPTAADNWQLRLEVRDIDPVPAPYQIVDDIILNDAFRSIRSTDFNGVVRSSSTSVITERAYGRKLTWSYLLYCSTNYYSGLCDKYCKPTNEDGVGHYSCNEAGDKTCLSGYRDPSTDCIHTYCSPNPCLHGGSCNPIAGDIGYTCGCPSGPGDTESEYTGRHCEIARDPCITNKPCRNGTCKKLTVGVYECTCYPGWTGTNCDTDTNECLSATPGRSCSPEGTANCTNLIGSFSCHCRPGWSGTLCSDMSDPCRALAPCRHGNCSNTGSTYTCACDSGWSGARCDTDIDECAAGTSGGCYADGTANCVNLNGSFACQCRPGWSGHLCSNLTDYCLATIPCMHGRCSNTGGGGGANFSCACDIGWSGARCETDIDECAAGALSGCNANGTANCVNLNGSFTCHCKPIWSGRLCSNLIDYCLATSPCLHGRCSNTGGDGGANFSCACDKGWSGARCDTDIDECAAGTSGGCYAGGTKTCVNLNGSFACQCRPGWSGFLCSNLTDYCLATSPCLHGRCSNTGGGGGANFSCACNSGWSGARCDTDIDECSLPGYCHTEGAVSCVNTNGSYVCSCRPRYEGSKCDTKTGPCDRKPCQHGNCSEPDGGSYACSCQAGWSGRNCSEDQDECLEPGQCSAVQACVNLPGGFRCDPTVASYWYLFLLGVLILLLAAGVLTAWRVLVCRNVRLNKYASRSSASTVGAKRPPNVKFPDDDRKTLDDWIRQTPYSYVDTDRNGRSPTLPPRNPNRPAPPPSEVPAAVAIRPRQAATLAPTNSAVYEQVGTAGGGTAGDRATLDASGTYARLRESQVLASGETGAEAAATQQSGPKPRLPDAPRPGAASAAALSVPEDSVYDNSGYLAAIEAAPPLRPVSNPGYLDMTANPEGYCQPIGAEAATPSLHLAPPVTQLPPKPPKVKRPKPKAKAPPPPPPPKPVGSRVLMPVPEVSIVDVDVEIDDSDDRPPGTVARLNSGNASNDL